VILVQDSSRTDTYESNAVHGIAVRSGVGGYQRLPDLLKPPNRTTKLPRPRIALALGGGGAKGAMHIGVLKALADFAIPIDVVAGTSVGAYIGLLHCAGLSPAEICLRVEADFRAHRAWNLIPCGPYLRLARILRNGHLARAIDRNVEAKLIEELQTPFLATSTDLATGEIVYFREGCIKTAVAASMNVPGLAPPISYQGRQLVDGGVLENLPVPAARAYGADIVIAVDISGDSLSRDKKDLRSTKAAINRALALQRNQRHESQISDADILIQPDVTGIRMADFARDPAELADIGETATRQKLRAYRNFLQAAA